VTVYRDRAGEEVALGEAIGEGGEGAVLAVLGDPRRCAKIFRPDRAAERVDKLLAMVGRRPSLSRHALAWPVELLYDDAGALAGYLMPAVRGAAELHRYLVPDERAQLAGWLTLGDLHRLGATVAEILVGVHRAGHCVGDLKPQNVLVCPRSLRVTLVDTDSFQILGPRGKIHGSPVVTPEYTAPELHGPGLARALRTPASDAFALAVIVYQLLLGGSHPFEGDGEGRVPDRIPRRLCPIVPGVSAVRAPASAIPFSTLHPSLQDAFVRCFGEAPSRRPSAAAFREALARSARDLVRCPRSAAHEHPRGLGRCPWCERRERTGLDLFPAGQRWQRATLARVPDPRMAPEAERARWLALHVRGRLVGGQVTPAERAFLHKAGAALGFARARVDAVIGEVAATPVAEPWARRLERARGILAGSLPRRALAVPAAALITGSAVAAGVLAGPWRPGGESPAEAASARACAVGGGWAVIGNTGGRGAFLREAPSTSSGRIGLAEGTSVRLTGQRVRAGDLTWSEVLVEGSGSTGWVAARYLVEPR
jgi:hypothetical protein